MQLNKQNGWKEKVQYSSACFMMLTGAGLSMYQCLSSGDITGGVLGYVAQTLVYAASIFGAGLYIQSKFGEIKNYLTEKEYVDSNNLDKEQSKLGEKQYQAAA